MTDTVSVLSRRCRKVRCAGWRRSSRGPSVAMGRPPCSCDGRPDHRRQLIGFLAAREIRVRRSVTSGHRASLTGMSDPQPRAYSVVDLPEQPFVGVTKTVTMSTMNEIADEIGGLVGWVLEHGHAPAGAPFLRYLVDRHGRRHGGPGRRPRRGTGRDRRGARVRDPPRRPVCVDPPRRASRRALRRDRRAPDLGRPGGLRFDKHPSEQGEVWANRVEWFESNPMEQPDMDQWVTRLTFKLAD